MRPSVSQNMGGWAGACSMRDRGCRPRGERRIRRSPRSHGAPMAQATPAGPQNVQSRRSNILSADASPDAGPAKATPIGQHTLKTERNFDGEQTRRDARPAAEAARAALGRCAPGLPCQPLGYRLSLWRHVHSCFNVHFLRNSWSSPPIAPLGRQYRTPVRAACIPVLLQRQASTLRTCL